METQPSIGDRAGALRSLIRFDAPLPGIVRLLMDSLEEELDEGQPPMLEVRDMYRHFVRIQSRELSPGELQEWARVVDGNSEILVENQGLYPILTELATIELTPERCAEIQLSLAGWRGEALAAPSSAHTGWRPRF